MIKILQFSLFLLLLIGCEKEKIIEIKEVSDLEGYDDCNDFAAEKMIISRLVFYPPSDNFPGVFVEIPIEEINIDTFVFKVEGSKYELTIKSTYPETKGYKRLDFFDEGELIYESGEIFQSQSSNVLLRENKYHFLSTDGWSYEEEYVNLCMTHAITYKRMINETDSLKLQIYSFD